MLIDVDRFKAVNDAYGHLAGDEVLVQIAGILLNLSRPQDTVSRMGGDEIALLLPACSEEAAIARAEMIRSVTAEHVFIIPGGTTLRLSISAGVAHATSDSVDLRALYSHADTALYEAKRSGRDQVCALAVVSAPKTVRDLGPTAGNDRSLISQAISRKHSNTYGGRMAAGERSATGGPRAATGPTGPLTLGVEEELHIVDIGTGELAARAPELLDTLSADSYGFELQQSTVETNTEVCNSLDELDREIRRLRRDLIAVTRPRRLGVAAVGTVPLDNSPQLDVTPTRRFTKMHEDYRLLVEEQLICGTQVHVGVADRDVAVAVSQRVLPWLPVFLSLSASSPYWHGHDTGYASIRTMIWQRCPQRGATGAIENAAAYDQLLDDLIATGVIADAKMAYFDVRPSAHVPRSSCACATPARWSRTRSCWPASSGPGRAAGRIGDGRRTAEVHGRPAGPPGGDVAGRAQRLSGELWWPDDPGPYPQPTRSMPCSTTSARTWRRSATGPPCENWPMRPWPEARRPSANARRSAAGAADRHRRSGGGRDRTPHAGPIPVAGRRRLRPAPSGRLRVEAASPALLRTRLDDRDRAVEAAGMLFIVDGARQPFEIDLIPRIISAAEWNPLAAGLAQRPGRSSTSCATSTARPSAFGTG